MAPCDIASTSRGSVLTFHPALHRHARSRIDDLTKSDGNPISIGASASVHVDLATSVDTNMEASTNGAVAVKVRGVRVRVCVCRCRACWIHGVDSCGAVRAMFCRVSAGVCELCSNKNFGVKCSILCERGVD